MLCPDTLTPKPSIKSLWHAIFWLIAVFYHITALGWSVYVSTRENKSDMAKMRIGLVIGFTCYSLHLSVYDYYLKVFTADFRAVLDFLENSEGCVYMGDSVWKIKVIKVINTFKKGRLVACMRKDQGSLFSVYLFTYLFP